MASSDRVPVAPPQPLNRARGALLAKVVIGSLDDPDVGVEAQYNPKDLAIEMSVPWTPTKQTKGEKPTSESTGGSTRTLTLELQFDGLEAAQSVLPAIAALKQMATMRKAGSDKDEDQRPHYVGVVWGTPGKTDLGPNLPCFRGVIQSLSTKLTMFTPSGMPVRATCSIKVLETDLFDRTR